MKKTCLTLLLIGVITFFISLKPIKPPVYPEAKWIRFEWDYSISHGIRHDKDVMLVPVAFNGYDQHMYMQFDLGADVTMLYEKSIQSYLRPGEHIRDLLDKPIDPSHVSDAGQSYGKLKPVQLQLDHQYLQPEAYLYLNYGEDIPKDRIAAQGKNYVGSIGADICKNKILIIDYPGQRMCFLDTLDEAFSERVDFTPSKIAYGRMRVPYTINGKVQWLMFDTGSSLTDIMTNRVNIKYITDPKNPVDSSSGNSWGKKTNFYNTKLTASCYLGHTELKDMKVSWSDNERLEKFNDNAGIYGLTGNSPFFNKVLVLDFKHQQIGIVK